MKTLSLRLPKTLDVSLTAAARQSGLTREAVARKALETFLADKSAPPGSSCYELASDVWGSLEGPDDLSCNKKHMEDYGR